MTQPLTKVFNYFDMETDRCAGIAVLLQIFNKRDENYAKVVSRYSLTGKSALEDLLDRGKTRNALIFQHAARLPFPPNWLQKQSKIAAWPKPPFHNYHLSIFITFPMEPNSRLAFEFHVIVAQISNFLHPRPSIVEEQKERSVANGG